MIDPELEGAEESEETVYSPAEAEILQDFGEGLPVDIADIADVLSHSHEALAQMDETKILALLATIDRSSSMTSLRNWWDRRSSRFQNFFMKMPPINLLFRELVNFGFLTVLGMSEDTWHRQQKISMVMGKLSTKFAARIFPLLKPWQPLFETLIALRTKKEELATSCRAYLSEHRQPPQEEQRLAA